MRIQLGQNTITRAERDSIIALVDEARGKLKANNDVLLRIVNGTLPSDQAYGTELAAYDAAYYEWEKIDDRFASVESELRLDKQVYNVAQMDRSLVSRWVALISQMYGIFQRHGVIAAVTPEPTKTPELGGIPLWIYGGVIFVAGLAAIAIWGYEDKPGRRTPSMAPPLRAVAAGGVS